MIKSWDDEAWDDYLYWQIQDKKTLKRAMHPKIWRCCLAKKAVCSPITAGHLGTLRSI
jgi:toxin YoeB